MSVILEAAAPVIPPQKYPFCASKETAANLALPVGKVKTDMLPVENSITSTTVDTLEPAKPPA